MLYGGAYTALGVAWRSRSASSPHADFIPYLGSAFALVAGLLMLLIGGGSLMQMVGVLIAYTVIQSLEGFVITPRVVGKTVGLRDVWVLFALFVGGELFGFMGVLLALPFAAVAKIFVARGVTAYRARTCSWATDGMEGAGASRPTLTAFRRDEPRSDCRSAGLPAGQRHLRRLIRPA